MRSRTIALGAGLLLAILATATAQAKLKVSGTGKQQTLVESQFEGEQLEAYRLFAVKCTKCHAMSRPIAALETGITPVTGGKFDEQGMKTYVVKMMRKPNSGITKEDARTILGFLMHARGLAQQDDK
jgi:hypothetical protein